MSGKSNSDKGVQVNVDFADRRISQGLGGFMNVRRGRSSDAQRLQTDPYYKSLWNKGRYGRRRGWSRVQEVFILKGDFTLFLSGVEPVENFNVASSVTKNVLLSYYYIRRRGLAEIEERLKKPVYLENDANAAALGEAVAGCGNGVKDFVAITLGTGVGSGIIINGKIHRGSNFCGGEMGHMVINVDGIPCNCGRKGCWEKYASATALVSQAVEAMQGNKASLLWQTCEGDLNKVEGKTIFEALDMGDETAKQVVDKYLYYVAIGLANVINIFQPEVVSIGGGISNEGEFLLKLVEPLVRQEQYGGDMVNLTEIRIAELKKDAGIIGAATLGIEV